MRHYPKRGGLDGGRFSILVRDLTKKKRSGDCVRKGEKRNRNGGFEQKGLPKKRGKKKKKDNKVRE